MSTVLGKCALYSLLLSAFITIASCKKKDTTEDNTPTTPTGAQLVGTIQTWDDKLNQINDKGGIIVSAIGNGDSTSTITDSAGKFQFNSLPFGNYNLVLSKVGYGTMKIFGVSHTYNATQSFTQVPNVDFGKIATTAVIRFSVQDSNLYHSKPGVRFRYGLTPNPSTTNVAYTRYFLGTDSAVSSSNYTVSDTLRTFKSYKQAGYWFSDLRNMGFTAGQTIYVRMYGDSYISNSYVDSTTGKRVFPNVNPASPRAIAVVVH